MLIKINQGEIIMKYIKNTALILCVCVLMSCNILGADDLKGHWAKDTIESLLNKNVISGYSDGSIKPDNYIKRAEFFTVINKMFGFNENAKISFKDVKSSNWYYNSVAQAVKAGYVSGYSDNTIKAENYITRAEAAMIIKNVLDLKSNESYILKFKDAADIDNWAKGAVGAAAEAGIITGYTDGNFCPIRSLTRAEAFTMIKRAYDYKETGKADNTPVQRGINTEANKDYKSPKIVNSVYEWKKAINYAIDNLYDKLDITIENYNKSNYDVAQFNYGFLSIVVQGMAKGSQAELNYAFDYDQNHKLIQAAKNNDLVPKLSQEEKDILNKARNIVSKLVNSSMSDYEKEKAIHDYMVLNYEYDTSDNIPEASYTIKGIMENKKGVCQAYANAFNMFSSIAGLECHIATGTSNGVAHAWNIVKIDNEYYHVDVTFDDPVPDTKGQILYTYFNLNDSELSKDHIWEKTINCNGTKYNYYKYNNLIITDLNALQKIINETIQKKAESIQFKTKGFAINSADDFKFILSQNKVKSYYVTGDFGKEGSFIFKPVYK